MLKHRWHDPPIRNQALIKNDGTNLLVTTLFLTEFSCVKALELDNYSLILKIIAFELCKNFVKETLLLKCIQFKYLDRNLAGLYSPHQHAFTKSRITRDVQLANWIQIACPLRCNLAYSASTSTYAQISSSVGCKHLHYYCSLRINSNKLSANVVVLQLFFWVRCN